MAHLIKHPKMYLEMKGTKYKSNNMIYFHFRSYKLG